MYAGGGVVLALACGGLLILMQVAISSSGCKHQTKSNEERFFAESVLESR
jgi:hypothetical protein